MLNPHWCEKVVCLSPLVCVGGMLIPTGMRWWYAYPHWCVLVVCLFPLVCVGGMLIPTGVKMWYAYSLWCVRWWYAYFHWCGVVARLAHQFCQLRKALFEGLSGGGEHVPGFFPAFVGGVFQFFELGLRLFLFVFQMAELLLVLHFHIGLCHILFGLEFFDLCGHFINLLFCFFFVVHIVILMF